MSLGIQGRSLPLPGVLTPMALGVRTTQPVDACLAPAVSSSSLWLSFLISVLHSASTLCDFSCPFSVVPSSLLYPPVIFTSFSLTLCISCPRACVCPSNQPKPTLTSHDASSRAGLDLEPEPPPLLSPSCLHVLAAIIFVEYKHKLSRLVSRSSTDAPDIPAEF